MYSPVLVSAVLSIIIVGGEKATSYVTVSNPKEGGYSYEVIHDYPTKESSATVHVYGYDEDYGVKDHGQDYLSYDFGAKIKNYSLEAAGAPAAHFGDEQKLTKKPGTYSASEHDFHEKLKDVPNFGVIHHSITTPGGPKPTGQTYTSTVVNIKHKTPANGGQKVHLKTLKTQSGTSYSYGISHSGVHQTPKQTLLKNKKRTGLRSNKGSFSNFETFHSSAIDPGSPFSNPLDETRHINGAKPIVHHHHYYHESSFSGNEHADRSQPKKVKSLEQSFGQADSLTPSHLGSISFEASLQHIPSEPDLTGLKAGGFESPRLPSFSASPPEINFHGPKDEGVNFNSLYDPIHNASPGLEDVHQFTKDDVSNDQTFGFNPSPTQPSHDLAFNFVDYRELSHHEVNPAYPQPPQTDHFEKSEGCSYKPPKSSSLESWSSSPPAKEKPSTKGKKGVWRPVFVSSSDDKTKFRTFRISRHFKPGKLIGGFLPSFGPPGHHETSGHTRAIEPNHVDFRDAEPDFHDTSLYNFDGVFSRLKEENEPSKSNSDNSDSSENKSLKDYHNSAPSFVEKSFRRKKTFGLEPPAALPIVVPPLRTTTIHRVRTVASTIPSADFKPFREIPSQISVHSFGGRLREIMKYGRKCPIKRPVMPILKGVCHRVLSK